MAFEIRLLIPEKTGSGNSSRIIPMENVTDGFIDDDPDRPLFLTYACQVFDACGVHFEVDGFFDEPLPLSTEYDLVFFLEVLPGFVRFLDDPLAPGYVIDLCEQGTEIRYEFTKIEGDEIIEVAYSSGIDRNLKNRTENVLRRELINQMVLFVKNYQKALAEYLSEEANHSWNQALFAFIQRWDE